MPVVVDGADPQQFQIEWDQVPTPSEVHDQNMEMLREKATTSQLGGGFPGMVGQGSTTNVTVTGDLGSLPPQAQAQIQALMGNLGKAFDQSAAGTNVIFDQPQVTINGQPVAGMPAGSGSMFDNLQQMAAAVAGNARAANLQPATATVLAAHDAPVSPLAAGRVPGGIVDITLDVRGPDGSAYTATTRVAFSSLERRAKLTQPGIEVPVLVHPANRAHVTIDAGKIPGL